MRPLSGLFVLLLFSPLTGWSASFCPGIYSAIQIKAGETISRARFWTMEKYEKTRLITAAFEQKQIPQNLSLGIATPSYRLGALDRAAAREIIESLNYEVGFFYEAELRFTILKDSYGDSWAFLIQKQTGTLAPETIAIYTVEQHDGRKKIQLLVEFSNSAIL